MTPKSEPQQRPSSRRHEPGTRFGALVLVAYVEPSAHGDSQARVECDCGVVKVVRVGNLSSGVTTTCGKQSRHYDSPTYSTVHQRLARERGPARKWACVMCGERASDWAYRHSDYEARADADGKDRGSAYSTDLDQYVPKCRSCHQKFDAAHKRSVPNGATSLAHVALALAWNPALVPAPVDPAATSRVDSPHLTGDS